MKRHQSPVSVCVCSYMDAYRNRFCRIAATSLTLDLIENILFKIGNMLRNEDSRHLYNILVVTCGRLMQEISLGAKVLVIADNTTLAFWSRIDELNQVSQFCLTYWISLFVWSNWLVIFNWLWTKLNSICESIIEERIDTVGATYSICLFGWNLKLKLPILFQVEEQMAIKEHDILVGQKAIWGPLEAATYTNEGSEITA